MKHLRADPLACISGFAHPKNRWHDDPLMQSYLDKFGVDVDALRRIYCLVPPSEDFVYSDVDLYFNYRDLTDPFEGLPYREAALWYRQYLEEQYSRPPEVLSYTEVCELIDKTKSPTALFAPKFANKGEVVVDPLFRQSYAEFVDLADKKEVDVLFSAARKEEIRLTEKINEGKARAFIITSIYHLLLDHSLTLDSSLMWFDNWFRAEIGIGFSLFGGRYHLKMERLFSFLKYSGNVLWYYDVGKWDKRFRRFLALLECSVQNSFYPRYCQLSKLMPPEWQGVDRQIDTWMLRRWITVQAFDCYLKMPHGEVIKKRGGQPSGCGQTGKRNTGGHKLITYMGAIMSGEFKSYYDYKLKNTTDHTGDDALNITSPGIRDGIINVLHRLDYPVDLCTVDYQVQTHDSVLNGTFNPDKAPHYLSTIPIMFNGFYVPYVDPAKILASLCFKSKNGSLIDQMQRLLAARLLLRYTESNQLLKSTCDAFIFDHFSSIHSSGVPVTRFFWTDDNIDSFYTGVYECSYSLDFLDAVCDDLIHN